MLNCLTVPCYLELLTTAKCTITYRQTGCYIFTHSQPLELPQNEASLSIGIMSTSSLVQELRPSGMKKIDSLSKTFLLYLDPVFVLLLRIPSLKYT